MNILPKGWSWLKYILKASAIVMAVGPNALRSPPEINEEEIGKN